ncbi:MAG: CvpA family protein [Firmicutes bacterium]|nr:CvpA family protein [Bacillota bacterium]
MRLEPGMILDILAAVILLLSIIWGARKGFAKTCLSFTQWFICIIAGFFLCTTIKEQLIEHTTLDEAIHNYILDQVQTGIETSAPYQSMPDLFSQWMQEESNEFIYGSCASITDIILTVLAFLLIILVVKIIGGVVVLLFSKEYHDGVIGCIDGVLGFLFGAVRGILMQFVLFALLVPVLTLLPGTLSIAVKTAIDQSMIASVLYDDNLLLILLRDLFS